MAKIARKIWKERSEDQADTVSVTAQPICPKCGELGRFSDEYCSKCGTKLLPKAELNIDLGEVYPLNNFFTNRKREHRWMYDENLRREKERD